MKKIYNPSMKEEPHDHPTWIIPPRQEETILSWIEKSGRFITQTVEDEDYDRAADEFVDEIIESESYRDNQDEDDDDDDEL